MKLGDAIQPRPKRILSGWEERGRVRHRDNLLKGCYALLQCCAFFFLVSRSGSFDPLWITIPMGILSFLMLAYVIASAYGYWKDYIRGNKT